MRIHNLRAEVQHVNTFSQATQHHKQSKSTVSWIYRHNRWTERRKVANPTEHPVHTGWPPRWLKACLYDPYSPPH
ncbi:hypothetical protein ILYODFUR_004900 [Ilyodon furcidens]|uniref:Uncharacterized protein n=1 Tax=Ilyodon furcidens TaxID=33524 RepID=A0ABV0TT39_9TELE